MSSICFKNTQHFFTLFSDFNTIVRRVNDNSVVILVNVFDCYTVKLSLIEPTHNLWCCLDWGNCLHLLTIIKIANAMTERIVVCITSVYECNVLKTKSVDESNNLFLYIFVEHDIFLLLSILILYYIL